MVFSNPGHAHTVRQADCGQRSRGLHRPDTPSHIREVKLFEHLIADAHLVESPAGDHMDVVLKDILPCRGSVALKDGDSLWGKRQVKQCRDSRDDVIA
ncbi:hypothetical protein GCM10008949_44860 [Deinococcus humi]|nr:hypothetical protein GCM10008949_44860 [Deinococcus humi]